MAAHWDVFIATNGRMKRSPPVTALNMLTSIFFFIADPIGEPQRIRVLVW